MMNKQIGVIFGISILAGCSSVDEKPHMTEAELHHYYSVPLQPTDNWIEENLPLFKLRADRLFAEEKDEEAYEFLIRIADHRAQSDIVAEQKQARVGHGLSLSYEDLNLGGSVSRQPDYIHVLGEGSLQKTSSKTVVVHSKASDPDGSNSDQVEDAIQSFKQVIDATTGQNYSHYELQRWERFCDEGKGMDERDWLFVESEYEKKHKAPEVIENCSPPKHGYDEYLGAWTMFCTAQVKDMTPSQKNIVRDSSRPHSVVNPCLAIK